MSRILLATIGSLGDIHPMIAIGLVLLERGHEVVFATSSYYHKRLAELGFVARTLRPDSINPTDAAMLGQLMDLQKGTERLLKGYIFANVQLTYEDMFEDSAGADVIVVGELGYAGRLVAEVRGIPWAFLALSPGSFLSAYDMPVLPGQESFAFLHKFGPTFNRFLLKVGQLVCWTWPRPYYKLAKKLCLPAQQNPIFFGKQSPYLVLAAFDQVFGKRQPDWPASAVLTGFAYHDSVPDLFDAGKQVASERLAAFLAAGDAPVVFTLGSAAMFSPGTFYEESLAAAKIINCRAVFLMGQNPLLEELPETMIAFDYIPFQDIFPHAACIVHQGGIGTSAQALRSGKPTLCVPYSHDQPDNAARLESLGTSLTLPRKLYKAKVVAKKLAELLSGSGNKYAAKAKEISLLMGDTDGARCAAAQIEKLVATVD